MPLRRLRASTPPLAVIALALAASGGLLLWCTLAPPPDGSAASLVEAQGLSDLALFTEARYTRHLALADYHAPFQDQPGALEHFPSGALTPPPDHLHAPLAR